MLQEPSVQATYDAALIGIADAYPGPIRDAALRLADALTRTGNQTEVDELRVTLNEQIVRQVG